MAAATLALVIVAIFQVCIYARQAGIMDRQAEIAQKQNEITIAANRAVVNFHSVGQAIRSGYYDYTFKIGNDGNATSGGLSITADCVRSDTANSEPFNLLVPTKNNVAPDLIPPKHEIEISAAVRTNCRLPFDEMVRIVDGLGHFYFLGEIKYNDTVVSSAKHLTQFAKELVIDVATNGRQQPIGSAISRGRHNCADEDCPK